MRGSTSVDKTSIAITLVVMLSVVGVGMVVFEEASGGDLKQRIQQDVSGFNSYCTERFGDDAEIYNSNSVTHGGLHCSAADGSNVVHFSQIPAGTLEDYRQGEISAHEVTASLQPVRTIWNQAIELAFVGLMIAVILIVLSMLRRHRGVAVDE